MAKIGRRIKLRREALGITQEELAKKLGYKSKTTIAKIENGVNDIVQSKVCAFAQALETTTGYLMGWDENEQKIKFIDTDYESGNSRNIVAKCIKIPVFDYITSPISIEQAENIVGWEEISEEMAKIGEYFGLVINGDSMEPRICKGDTVIVRKQSDIDSGDIAIVIINGDYGTCKKVVKHENGLSLISLNPAFQPLFYTWQEVESIPITINGKVVELRGKL